MTSTNDTEQSKAGKQFVRRVSIRVQETFKGTSGDTLIVEDDLESCSLGMQKGDRVILFLREKMISDQCNGSAVLHTDDVLRKRFKMDEEIINARQALLRTRVAELRNSRPKKWWQLSP